MTKAAEPLLMLPGTLCDERVFAPVIGGLGVEVIVPALGGAETAPAMAQRILSVAPPRFALCGFSLGGIVALEMMAQAPERITRLALLGANPRPIPEANIPLRRHSVERAVSESNSVYIDEAWDRSVTASRADDRAFRAELDAMAAATTHDAFRQQIEITIHRADSRPRLRHIDVPVLLAVGAEDRVCPPEMSREMAAAMPHARLEVVPGAGHYLTLDQPTILARLLRDWLSAPNTSQIRFLKEFS